MLHAAVSIKINSGVSADMLRAACAVHGASCIRILHDAYPLRVLGCARSVYVQRLVETNQQRTIWWHSTALRTAPVHRVRPACTHSGSPARGLVWSRRPAVCFWTRAHEGPGEDRTAVRSLVEEGTSGQGSTRSTDHFVSRALNIVWSALQGGCADLPRAVFLCISVSMHCKLNGSASP